MGFDQQFKLRQQEFYLVLVFTVFDVLSPLTLLKCQTVLLTLNISCQSLKTEADFSLKTNVVCHVPLPSVTLQSFTLLTSDVAVFYMS